MAEAPYRFSKNESLIPDVSVLIKDRPGVQARGHMTFPREIVVEVVSSESEILIYTPTGIAEFRRKDILATPLLPGIFLPLEELFS